VGSLLRRQKALAIGIKWNREGKEDVGGLPNGVIREGHVIGAVMEPGRRNKAIKDASYEVIRR